MDEPERTNPTGLVIRMVPARRRRSIHDEAPMKNRAPIPVADDERTADVLVHAPRLAISRQISQCELRKRLGEILYRSYYLRETFLISNGNSIIAKILPFDTTR